MTITRGIIKEYYKKYDSETIEAAITLFKLKTGNMNLTLIDILDKF